MITGQWNTQNWRLPLWSPCANRHRQQVEPGFIDPQNSGLLLLGFFLKEKQERNSRHCLDLAEGALQRCGDVLERSHCQLNTTSVTAQRGVNAVWLGDYERAVSLIDKGLLKYDPTFVRGRARLVAQKAEALYGLQYIPECAMIAEEAMVLANSVSSMKTIARVKMLQQSLAQSRWKNEPGVARLGALLSHKGGE